MSEATTNLVRSLMRRLMVLVLASINIGACRPEAEAQAQTRTNADAGIGVRLASGAVRHAAFADSVRFRRLWSGSGANFYAMHASRASELVTDIDWEFGGDVALRSLTTGKLQRVTRVPAGSPEFVEKTALSADGQRIAYNWFSAKTLAYQLRVINADGSGERVLISAPELMQYFEPQAWTRDGNNVLVTLYRADKTIQLALVSVADGSVRILKSLDWRGLGRAALSADDRFVAYDSPHDMNPRQRDILVLALDGSRERRVVETGGRNQILGWLSNPDALLYYADRSIWRLPLRDGIRQGEPELVRPNVWNLEPIGFSTAGYVYGVSVESPGVHVARVDLATGRLLSPLAPVPSSLNRGTGWGAWSPDGNRLAFVALPAANSTIIVSDIESGDEREIVVPLTSGTDLTWANDGKSIYTYARGGRGQEGLYRIELASGAVTYVPTPRLADMKDVFRRGYSLSPNARTMFVRKPAMLAGVGAILAYDFETDAVHELYPANGSGRVGVSPDGQRIAWADHCNACPQRLLKVGSADGKVPARTIYEFETSRFLNARSRVQFTPDGRHVVILAPEPGDTSSVAIRLVPVDGGSPRTIHRQSLRDAGAIMDVRVDPTGRRIALVTGRSQQEIWIMEGLSALSAAK